MSEILLYHGSKVEVAYPEIRITKYTKDFSWGFYCTNDYKQAYRWADRRSGNGFVNVYKYIENPQLKILHFSEMTDEWLDFIARCRKGEPHSYDIVEGPMADDTIWDFVNGFMSGKISRSVFWEYAKFKYPTHQISFHTVNALRCLTFERSESIHDGQTKRKCLLRVLFNRVYCKKNKKSQTGCHSVFYKERFRTTVKTSGS